MDQEFLRRIWGTQPGYVFLPYKTPSRWRETTAVQWPSETVPQTTAADADQYFAPLLFSKPQRKQENALKPRWLYADLDAVNPRKLTLPPTIALQTSPGNFQGFWELARPITTARHQDLNRRLTYATGADKGGWGLTKVLRVPDTLNHKYTPARDVKILWDNKRVYTIGEIQEFVKTVESHDLDPLVHNLTLPAETRGSIIRRIKERLGSRGLALLSATSLSLAADSEEGRSGLLWELECRLLEAGLDPEEVFVVVRDTIWNKFKDRSNADDYLWKEVQKAHLHTAQEQKVDEETGFIRLRPRTISFADLLGSKYAEPDWMIEDWWTLNSHGIIAGLPKSYKSLVSLDMAISISSNSPFLGQFNVNPKAVGPVIVVQQENSMSLLRDRLWKMTDSRGLHAGKVSGSGDEIVVQFPPSIPLFFYNDFGFDMSMPEDREAIEELIQKEGARMIVFDPLYLMIGGSDENNAKEMRPILSWLLRIRNLYNCSVVVVHHWGKGSTDRKGRGAGGIKLLGSTTIYGWLEAALYVEAKTDGPNIEVVVEREFRERLSPPPTGFTLSMGDIGDTSYVWEASGVVGKENKILAILGDAGADGISYKTLGTSLNVGAKKIRADLAPLLNDQSIVVRTIGKEKRFYLAERAPDSE